MPQIDNIYNLGMSGDEIKRRLSLMHDSVRKYTTADYPNLYSFKDLTWKEIAEIAKTSDPSWYWSLGDYKTFTHTIQGVQCDIPITIIDFNHDDVVDKQAYGKAKAGVTLMIGGTRKVLNGQEIPGILSAAEWKATTFLNDDVFTSGFNSFNIPN